MEPPVCLGDEGRAISLKKAGIFPIVHGVRSLALARRVAATGTAERIAALVEGGVLDAALGDELVQSLHFLMGLRLQGAWPSSATGRQVTGNVDPERLSSLERDLLKDALVVVAAQGVAAPAPAAGSVVKTVTICAAGWRSCGANGCCTA